MSLKRYRVGDLRPSQILYSFGVGASVDLANLAVMVMGLDQWHTERAELVAEGRLLQAVQRLLGPTVAQLLTPPAVPADEIRSPFDDAARIGIPVRVFPRWLRCPACQRIGTVDGGLFELKDPHRPDRARYVHISCEKGKNNRPPAAVPVRFVVACENGHIDDFPWVSFVHRGKSPCPGALRLQQTGLSDGVTDVLVRCDACEAVRPLSAAFGEEGKKSLPTCRGHHPHLLSEEECQIRNDSGQYEPTQVRTLLLGATNSWFSMTLSALSVPESKGGRLAKLVDDHWDGVLSKALSLEILGAFRSIGQLSAFEDFSDDELWQAIQLRQEGPSTEEPEREDLKLPEWLAFSRPEGVKNDQDFAIRETPIPSGFTDFFQRVVLVDRLREVRALVGFTRIASPGEFGEEYQVPAERRAPLASKAPTWVPAMEVRGEGIFIQFNEAVLAHWCNHEKSRARDREYLDAHRRWRSLRGITPPSEDYPGIRYILLHSFAHALMRQLVLECGYTSAAVRERIYASDPGAADGPMAGVLIYTAAADSEGTLGGLVAQGHPQNLGRHLYSALDSMTLCSSDPLCASHQPIQQESISLHGAACHACLFAPETSCERGNKYLDRGMLMPTLSGELEPFFRGLGDFQSSVAEVEQGIVGPAEAPLRLPRGLYEDPDGLPLYTVNDLIHGWADCPDPTHRVAVADAPADGFLLTLPVDLLDAWPIGEVHPLVAGALLLCQPTAPEELTPDVARLLLLGRNSRFRSTGEPWTVGFSRLQQPLNREPEVRVSYRSRTPSARPETVPADKVSALARLLAVYHQGKWLKLQ